MKDVELIAREWVNAESNCPLEYQNFQGKADEDGLRYHRKTVAFEKKAEKFEKEITFTCFPLQVRARRECERVT